MRPAATTSIAIIAFGLGCPRPSSPPPKTHVRLVVVGAAPSDSMLWSCRTWGDYLGLSCGFEDSGQVECNRSWRHDHQICQLTLGLVFEAGLAQKIGHDAESDRDHRTARFDAMLLTAPVFRFRVAITHELGHLILDTAEHTKTGVMAGIDVMLSDDDKALASRTQ